MSRTLIYRKGSGKKRSFLPRGVHRDPVPSASQFVEVRPPDLLEKLPSREITIGGVTLTALDTTKTPEQKTSRKEFTYLPTRYAVAREKWFNAAVVDGVVAPYPDATKVAGWDARYTRECVDDTLDEVANHRIFKDAEIYIVTAFENNSKGLNGPDKLGPYPDSIAYKEYHVKEEEDMTSVPSIGAALMLRKFPNAPGVAAAIQPEPHSYRPRDIAPLVIRPVSRALVDYVLGSLFAASIKWHKLLDTRAREWCKASGVLLPDDITWYKHGARKVGAAIMWGITTRLDFPLPENEGLLAELRSFKTADERPVVREEGGRAIICVRDFVLTFVVLGGLRFNRYTKNR